MTNKKIINSLIIILFFLLIFRDVIETYMGLSFFGYLDELVALLALPLFVANIYKNRGRIKKNKKYGLACFVAILFFIGLVSSFVFQYQNFSASATDAFLVLKFWLSLYVGRQIAKVVGSKTLGKISTYSSYLIVFFSILTFADYFLHLFNSTYRYGLRTEQLFYSHTTIYCATVLTLMAAYLIGLQNNKKPKISILIIGCLLMCSTLRTKAIAAVCVMIGVYYLLYLRKKEINIRTLIIFIPAVVWIAWDQIIYYFFSDIQNDSARYQLLEKSVLIAKEHFPLGSGFGSFGSYASTVNYSRLYSVYGISNVNGLRINDTSFATDSFWPMILAQFGFLGLIIFVLIIFRLFKNIQTVKNMSKSSYLGCLFIFIYLLIISLAESAFVHPISIPMALLLGVCFGLSRKEKLS